MFKFPTVLVLTGGLFLLCLGIALEYQKRYGGAVAPYFILTVPGLLLLVVKAAADRRNRWEPALDDWLRRHTAAVDALPARFDSIWIALAAGLGLYAELALIRYHSSCFQLFAFFKNFSLLSCFLGLGIGYALGAARLLR